MPEQRANGEWRSYDLVRTGGFIAERILVSLIDTGRDAPGTREFAPNPLACDRRLPRWFVASTALLVVTLAVACGVMVLATRGQPVFKIAAMTLGVAVILIVLLSAAMALAPVRVYRIGTPIDGRRASSPIVTIRQRAVGHRKYVVKDDAGRKLARIRRTPAAGHLRIDRFGPEVANPITVRARISRRMTGQKTFESALHVSSGVSNLIHPPWNSVQFLARRKHDQRPKSDSWAIASAERGGGVQWMRVSIDHGAAGAHQQASLPGDLVLLSAACLLLSLEGAR